MIIKSKLLIIMSGGVFMGFLKGKTAIITGGGRAVLQDGSCGSIGYGIATAYAKEGANLVLTGRNVKKLTDAKEELESKYGIKVLPVHADISAGADNEATVKEVVKKTIDEFERPCVQLASPDFKYMTGETITLEGGLGLRP